METSTMRTTIKLMLLVAVGATWLAAPAFAKPRHVHIRLGGFEYSPAPGYTVVEGGRYLGRDPDPSIRFELRRDAAQYEGNN